MVLLINNFSRLQRDTAIGDGKTRLTIEGKSWRAVPFVLGTLVSLVRDIFVPVSRFASQAVGLLFSARPALACFASASTPPFFGLIYPNIIFHIYQPPFC
jgi:hypothetical protein